MSRLGGREEAGCPEGVTSLKGFGVKILGLYQEPGYQEGVKTERASRGRQEGHCQESVKGLSREPCQEDVKMVSRGSQDCVKVEDNKTVACQYGVKSLRVTVKSFSRGCREFAEMVSRGYQEGPR